MRWNFWWAAWGFNHVFSISAVQFTATCTTVKPISLSGISTMANYTNVQFHKKVTHFDWFISHLNNFNISNVYKKLYLVQKLVWANPTVFYTSWTAVVWNNQYVICHPDSNTTQWCFAMYYLSDKCISTSFNMLLNRPDGNFIWFYVQIFHLLYQQQLVVEIHFRLFYQDITDFYTEVEACILWREEYLLLYLITLPMLIRCKMINWKYLAL